MMKKTILLTGATDGIGLETAKMLAELGHKLLIHGRNETKLDNTKSMLQVAYPQATIESYRSDLSTIAEVVELSREVLANNEAIDVLINNAGVYKVPNALSPDGYDVRFIVNTIAPFLLTHLLSTLMKAGSRVVNLSSAAQAPVSLKALEGAPSLSDSVAYAQSKLAITMWSFHLSQTLGDNAPAIIAVNPASLLGSNMVKEAYGTSGKDIGIGAKILVKAALSDEFADASGQYYDNDIQAFAAPHPDALSTEKNKALVAAIERVLNKLNIQF